ncbi:MAG: hypothetical protein Q4F79_05300 [Eubacteriales bacterium]|nr:hypothetical protein [Eubacteriales bacterium]
MLSKKIEQMKSYPPYRRWHAISYLVFLIGCMLVCLSLVVSVVVGDNTNAVSVLMGYAAIICVIAYFLINFIYWRCPKCHKTLPVFGPVLVCNVCKRKFLDEKGKPIW